MELGCALVGLWKVLEIGDLQTKVVLSLGHAWFPKEGQNPALQVPRELLRHSQDLAKVPAILCCGLCLQVPRKALSRQLRCN